MIHSAAWESLESHPLSPLTSLCLGVQAEHQSHFNPGTEALKPSAAGEHQEALLTHGELPGLSQVLCGGLLGCKSEGTHPEKGLHNLTHSKHPFLFWLNKSVPHCLSTNEAPRECPLRWGKETHWVRTVSTETGRSWEQESPRLAICEKYAPSCLSALTQDPRE